MLYMISGAMGVDTRETEEHVKVIKPTLLLDLQLALFLAAAGTKAELARWASRECLASGDKPS